MDYIDYFKSQAKKFYKDFKTQYVDENDEYGIYYYRPKFWPDLDEIILSFDIDEDHFSLMKAQHIVAYLADFRSLNELIHASEARLEIGYYLLERRENNFLEEWQWYKSYAKLDRFNEDETLEIFKQVYLNSN